jgi:REP element-mobilizing transposase RayT
MPRPESHIPGAFYHVTLRGAYRSEIFFTPDDRRLLIGILSEVIERFAGKVHCYSNADDSLQLLIQVGEEPLGRMMLRVARRYAHAVLGRLENSLAQTLPDAVDVVNRLFDMRFRSTCGPCSSAPKRAAVTKH